MTIKCTRPVDEWA